MKSSFPYITKFSPKHIKTTGFLFSFFYSLLFYILSETLSQKKKYFNILNNLFSDEGDTVSQEKKSTKKAISKSSSTSTWSASTTVIRTAPSTTSTTTTTTTTRATTTRTTTAVTEPETTWGPTTNRFSHYQVGDCSSSPCQVKTTSLDTPTVVRTTLRRGKLGQTTQ